MKKAFLWIVVALAAVLLTTFAAQASPFLVCDPQAGVTHYKITGDPFWAANIPAQPDGSIRTDLAGIPSGSHSISVSACRADVWGEECASAPFTFTKPTGPGAPGNIRLVP